MPDDASPPRYYTMGQGEPFREEVNKLVHFEVRYYWPDDNGNETFYGFGGEVRESHLLALSVRR